MLPYRIEWLTAASSDVRRLDRPTAMRIFDGILHLHYARTGGGDVAPLHGEMVGSFCLRLGDCRVLFTLEKDTLRIFGVRHRSALINALPRCI
jgi:mRNA-degrading endonuclease RelE of RelBE toxin-antitoxin system